MFVQVRIGLRCSKKSLKRYLYGFKSRPGHFTAESQMTEAGRCRGLFRSKARAWGALRSQSAQAAVGVEQLAVDPLALGGA